MGIFDKLFDKFKKNKKIVESESIKSSANSKINSADKFTQDLQSKTNEQMKNLNEDDMKKMLFKKAGINSIFINNPRTRSILENRLRDLGSPHFSVGFDEIKRLVYI